MILENIENGRTGEIIVTAPNKNVIVVREYHDKYGNAPYTDMYYYDFEKFSSAYKEHKPADGITQSKSAKKKYYWAIDTVALGDVDRIIAGGDCDHCDAIDQFNEEIGNRFDTEKDCRAAVKWLKALTRLRNRGLKFNGWDDADRGTINDFSVSVRIDDISDTKRVLKDLDLVFGGCK